MRKLLNGWFAVMIVCGVNLHAQHFRWEAPVGGVDSTGFVRILLQPEVTSTMRDPFLDVRIYDEDSVEVPYIGSFDRIVKGYQRFVEYPVVDIHNVYHHSWVTVENPLHKTNYLDHLVMEVNNTEVKREMTLTGSYDGRNWYALKDEFYFNFYETYDENGKSSTSLVQFDFPRSDYRFFRFNFHNWRDWWYDDYSAPVFVVRAGILEQVTPASVKENWLEVPAAAINQTEDKANKRSEVFLDFAEPQFVDYMRFDVSTTNPTGKYFRGVQLYKLDIGFVNGKLDTTETLLSSTIISAGNLNELSVGGKVRHLLLRINNADDQPIHVNATHGIQIKHYLLTYLEKDKKYMLRFSNDSVSTASYDLRYLGDSLALAELKIITAGPRVRIPDIPQKPLEPKAVAVVNTIFTDNTAIWIAMGIVVLILLWMSGKMLREMRSR